MTRKINNSYTLGQSNAPTDGGDMLKTRGYGTLVWEGVADTTFVPWAFGGTNYGYHSAGNNSAGYFNNIEKYSLSSDANATDVGDLTAGNKQQAGSSSTDYGYMACGNRATGAKTNVIEKFSFASDANATDVGDVTVGRENYPAGTQY